MIDYIFYIPLPKSQLPRRNNGNGGHAGSPACHHHFVDGNWIGEGNQRAYFLYGLGCDLSENCFTCSEPDDCHYKPRRVRQ